MNETAALVSAADSFQLKWSPSTLLESLAIMGKGLLGIFAVIAVIYLVVWGLNKFTKTPEKK